MFAGAIVKRTSPKRKVEQANNINGNMNGHHHNNYESCFNSVTAESLKDDFDFDANLALFDKKAFYEEMNGGNETNLPINTPIATSSSINETKSLKTQQHSYHPLSLETLFGTVNQQQQQQHQQTSLNGLNSNTTSNHASNQITPLSSSVKNYRCDENVLNNSEPIVLSQIELPIKATRHYVTDDGLIVPCINNELKHRLFDESYKLGYTKQRQIESMARCCAEMSLTLLGGPTRFLPKNNHQKPKVLVLANNEIQGAYALCVARLLSIRNVHVYLFVHNSSTLASQIDAEYVQSELKILNTTDAKIIKNVDGKCF